jgi:hypothetical protein
MDEGWQRGRFVWSRRPEWPGVRPPLRPLRSPTPHNLNFVNRPQQGDGPPDCHIQLAASSASGSAIRDWL